MSISQVTWPLFGQLDISDENFEPPSSGAAEKCLLLCGAPHGQRSAAAVDAGIGIREYRL
jgi:hypothetical protein